MTEKKNQVLCLVHVLDPRYNVTIFSELCVLEELDFSVNKVLAAAAATLNDDMVLKLNWQIEWLTKSSVDGQHYVPHVVIVVDQGFLCSKKRRSFIFCWVLVYTLKSQAESTQSFKALEDEKITLGHSEKSIWRESGAAFGFSLRVRIVVVRIIVFFRCRTASTKI